MTMLRKALVEVRTHGFLTEEQEDELRELAASDRQREREDLYAHERAKLLQRPLPPYGRLKR